MIKDRLFGRGGGGGGGGGRKEDWNSYLHLLVGKIYLHFVVIYVLQRLPENKYIERLALPR